MKTCSIIGHKAGEWRAIDNLRIPKLRSRCRRCGALLEKFGEDGYMHELDEEGRFVRGPPQLQMLLWGEGFNRKLNVAQWGIMLPGIAIYSIVLYLSEEWGLLIGAPILFGSLFLSWWVTNRMIQEKWGF